MIENNNKYVRGKKRSIEDIENYILYQYDVKKLEDCEYELNIPYKDEKDLNDQIDEIVARIDSKAEMRHCSTEISVRALDGSDKYWY